MKRLLTGKDDDFPLKVSDVDVSEHLWDGFGNSETEVSAGWIVRFLQSVGSWRPFTRKEINAFYTKYGPGDGFRFNRLLDGKYGDVVEIDGLCHVTTTFVAKCFLSNTKAAPRSEMAIASGGHES